MKQKKQKQPQNHAIHEGRKREKKKSGRKNNEQTNIYQNNDSDCRRLCIWNEIIVGFSWYVYICQHGGEYW